MTYKEILTLLSAGYTKAEIDALDAPDAPQAEAPDHSTLLSAEPQPSSQSGEAVPSSPAAEPDPQPAQEDPLQKIKNMFAGFLAGLQQNNRENADMGGKIIDPHESAINTLRSISDIPTKYHKEDMK